MIYNLTFWKIVFNEELYEFKVKKQNKNFKTKAIFIYMVAEVPFFQERKRKIKKYF